MFRSAIVLSTLVASCSPFAIACSCSNSTPVQATLSRYRERAVFTAHVIQSVGRVYRTDGKQLAVKALAIVRDRYWGLPWYWPKIVLLDGGTMCGTGILIGQDYLVDGQRTSYGVLDISFCSRTAELERNPVDLRTLDGSLCASPGVTLIGHVESALGEFGSGPLIRDATVTFRDKTGKAYRTKSDGQGIYILTHLPPGNYIVDSNFGPNQYAVGGGVIADGGCLERTVRVFHYVISGLLAPGMETSALVNLIPVSGGLSEAKRSKIISDGHFYFDDIPPGDYELMVGVSRAGLPGQRTEIYYPGTRDRRKATRIHVSGQPIERSFDFDPRVFH